jgi:hypothetical protein
MRIVHHFIFVLAIVIAIGGGDASSIFARTLETGDASTSWIGTGEVYDLVDGGQVIHSIVRGAMIVRPFEGLTKGTVHTAQLVCSVRVTVNAKEKQSTQLGLCSIIAHGGKDVAYAQWKCDGDLKECEGTFTFTGGTGGFSGMSGTTPFFNRVIFEKLEAGNARAVGYAAWPNLSYTLP